MKAKLYTLTFFLLTLDSVIYAADASSACQSFDSLIAAEEAQVSAVIQSDPDFAPFRSIPAPLLKFLICEKHHMYMVPGTRQMVDDAGEVISGYAQNYGCHKDLYHPQNFQPFTLKGFWIPADQGDTFSILDPTQQLPIFRDVAGKKEVLFLVHPKSETLFHPLMQAYAHKQIEVRALALSSFRTLLVAIPDGHEYQLMMIKVSLDETINKAPRVISLKESAGSVAETCHLKSKAKNLVFMEDVYSFVPRSELLDPKRTQGKAIRAGMLVRKIPEILLDPHARERVVPLYALFGNKNRALLDLMINNSKKTPTQFILEDILQPYARLYVDLLFNQQISLEVHGQNLMLVLDDETAQPIKGREFLYRDMGGVNSLLSSKELSRLPAHLRDPDFFYFATHVKDAATSMEDHFFHRTLFNLTKQFVKSPDYAKRDPVFDHWKTQMEQKSFLVNWTIVGKQGDLHKTQLKRHEYCYYGYFAKHFARILFDEIDRQGIFRDICDLSGVDGLFEPADWLDQRLECTDPVRWFHTLIFESYTWYLTSKQ